MPSVSQFPAIPSEVETSSAHHERTEMAAEQPLHDQVVGEAMNNDEGKQSLPPSSTPSSAKRKRVRFDLLSETPDSPEPVVRRYRKLRCIDNDIKREKKRSSMFDGDETAVTTKKRKTLKSPPPSPLSSPSLAPEQIDDADVLPAEAGTMEGMERKSEAQDEPQQQQSRRRGPVYYHMKLRERLVQRDAATSSAPSHDDEPEHEQLDRLSLYAPPVLPAELAASREPNLEHHRVCQGGARS
ncbi:hypothetical protein PG990_006755 [Apiospora arundinis]